jgi:NADPH-dependent curcumin reductase CurA
MENDRYVLARRPNGLPQPEDFRLERTETTAPGPGQVIVKNLFLGLTPGDRLFLNEKAIGRVVRGATVSRVVATGSGTSARIGEVVATKGGWQEYATVGDEQLTSLKPDIAPKTLYLSMLGGSGLAALFGVQEVLRLRPAESVLVSGAAGVVGSLAAQLAKHRGCRVIGVCHSLDSSRRQWLRDEVGLESVLSAHEIPQRLPQLAPDGIDAFFDNIGGELLDNVLRFINRYGRKHARVALCGMMSQYNRPEGQPPYGVQALHCLVNQSVDLRGFLVSDFRERYGRAREQLAQLLRSGRLVPCPEHLVVGLENTPLHFARSLAPGSPGKAVVRLRD